ncbi:MAG: alpha/beta hydrolase, partial [Rhodocyclaceae bacterium]|nr:alpha/beta hydrolase [Rhodocyclaceae bacterium]
LYDAIRCPTLIIRGENSDLLTRATVAAMQERGPRALAVEIPNVGHAPMFMDDAQLAVVSEFLQSAGA